MTNHEEFALTWHLAYWQDDYSYSEIIEQLKDGIDDSVYTNSPYGLLNPKKADEIKEFVED